MTAFVYVMGRAQGPCKIGMSKNPAARAVELQPGCPFRLEVLHKVECESARQAYDLEQWFHYCHPDLRLVGEWFSTTAVDAIEFLRDPVPEKESWV
jgi:hypothetical protein